MILLYPIKCAAVGAIVGLFYSVFASVLFISVALTSGEPPPGPIIQGYFVLSLVFAEFTVPTAAVCGAVYATYRVFTSKAKEGAR